MTSKEWENIKEAVINKNRAAIRKAGKAIGKPKLHQEGVSVEEVIRQVLAMAPGDHPHLGPILLDLADKIQSEEWH